MTDNPKTVVHCKPKFLKIHQLQSLADSESKLPRFRGSNFTMGGCSVSCWDKFMPQPMNNTILHCPDTFRRINRAHNDPLCNRFT